MIYCVFVFFFFKQKTAYEMRISDWSSDVCSSDLTPIYRSSIRTVIAMQRRRVFASDELESIDGTIEHQNYNQNDACGVSIYAGRLRHKRLRSEERRDGKECVGRVKSGGRRIIKKKKKERNENTR